MLIGNHISTDLHEISISDSIALVIDKMNEFHSKQLAVVENGIFYGLIEESSLLNEENLDLSIQELSHLLRPVYLFEYQHIYDALNLISNNDYCFIPVLDKNHKYLGSLTKQRILVAINKILGTEDSAILVLELGARDNALSHIARIIENENSTIYSTAIHQMQDSTQLELTIKLSKANLAAVISSLWRNDYVVKATFRDDLDQSDIQNRYQLLMNYLNI